MIASLRGTVIDKGLDYAVIECAGVGYHCVATASTLAELSRGQEATVLTSFVVREDSQTLYAFSTSEQREMFGVLQKVSGVGARLALGVMSVLSPADIVRAVSQGDIKALQRAPGVGKRLAERMAVDLKDKVAAVEVGGTTPPTDAQLPGTAPGTVGIVSQVVEALVGLGFTENKAEAAVAAALERSGAETSASALLRTALSILGGSKP
ncbi:Holliday junction branch migration protein RuvA [Corynebacterium heidelbergense]|uniref:Holliday junction branch migration complex subunit RuvA n=1 Tax=Corynebacterium heidelbergense TaxID=2055947 RepID=A0A364V7R9_9CORY|nr:Holliday junction branch migration protein RuvA [Corynebacterium heidelbergense]RAV32710.1 Holliday junction branch migration protein RuvA [Corynebacterium heidelbergense]